MSLHAAGYDLVMLINERILNQVSGALYYNGFLRLAKEVDLLTLLPEAQREQVDPVFHPFMKLKVRAQMLHEPVLDFRLPEPGCGGFRIHFVMALRVMVTLWDGLEMPFDGKLSMVAEGSVEKIPTAMRIDNGVYGQPVLSVPEEAGVSPALVSMLKGLAPSLVEPGGYALLVDFTRSDIETFSLTWQEKQAKGLTIDLGDLVETVIKEYLSQDGVSFGIGLPSLGVFLQDLDPQTGLTPENDPIARLRDRFSLELAALKVVSPQALALAFNFMGWTGGDPDKLTDFLRNCTLGLAMPEITVNRMIRFAMEKVLCTKPWSFQYTKVIDRSNDTFALVSKVWDLYNRVVVELASLGFVEYDVVLESLRFEIDMDVWFTSIPEVDMMPGNIIRISDCEAKVNLHVRAVLESDVKVEIDPTSFFFDIVPDIEVYHRHERVCILDAFVMLDKVGISDAAGTIRFNDVENRLGLALTDLNLGLEAALQINPAFKPFQLPDLVERLICDYAEEAMRKNFNQVFITAPMRLTMTGFPWEMKMRGRKVHVDAQELTATMDAWFAELKKNIPMVPIYIGNINTMEVHRIGCDGLKDTYVEHQRGYHLLNEALNWGFDGCGRCLPAFHRRS